MSGKRFATAEEILAEARNGRIFILVDDEQRTGQGNFVLCAQHTTAAAINFMASHGRGLVCLAMAPDRVDALGLPLINAATGERQDTAFTVSIEAREGVSTGISAADRARTVLTAIDPAHGPEDLVTPGHVFPLRAREGGVLVRAGHTEAGVDIARLAGLYPAAILCGILRDDGAMASMPDLLDVAALHGVKIGTVRSLIHYRRQFDHYVDHVLTQPIESVFAGPLDALVYRSRIDGGEILALKKGDIRRDRPTLVRLHEALPLYDLIGLSGDRASLVQRCLAEIGRNGSGILLLLNTMRPDLFSSALRDGDHRPAMTVKDYGLGAQILADMGVGQMELLTTQPQQMTGISGFGLDVTGLRHLAP